MSKAIVKQALELFEDTFEDSKKLGSEQKSGKKRKSVDNSNKFAKKLTLDQKYSGETIDQVRKRLRKQSYLTEENLRKLKAISQGRVSKDTSSSIFKRGSRAKEEPETVKVDEGTVFTEEDFLKFERKYLV